MDIRWHSVVDNDFPIKSGYYWVLGRGASYGKVWHIYTTAYFYTRDKQWEFYKMSDSAKKVYRVAYWTELLPKPEEALRAERIGAKR